MTKKQILITATKIWLTSSVLVGFLIGLIAIPIVGPMAIAVFLMISVYALIFSASSIFLLYLAFNLLLNLKAKKYKGYILLLVVSVIVFIQFTLWDYFMNYEKGFSFDFLKFSEMTLALFCSILASIIATIMWTRKYFDFKINSPNKS